MSEVQPFVFPATEQQVRVVMADGDPWFAAADVCAVLGYAHTASALRMLRDNEKGVRRMHTLGGEQDVTVISEPGLYRLIMRSNRPEAEAFQDWVTAEVLPAIRRTGSYGTSAEPRATREDIVASITRRELAAMVIAEADRADAAEAHSAQLEAAAAEVAPKVEAYDAFMEADGTYEMVTVGNMLGIGRNTLFARLREQHILKDDNTPYQRYAHHFKVIGGSHDQNGREVRHVTTRVRPSGIDFLRRRLFPPGTQLTLVS